MPIKQEKQYPSILLPLMVFIVALSFLIGLLVTIKPGVFFSGDAGLKYLVLKQISTNGHYYTLNLQSPAWVNNIWSRGFYPLKPPFIYDGPQGKIVSFPPAFQWLNSFFYSWFGYRGIYIIPCISIIGVWMWFMALLNRVGVKPFVISMGLLLLALGSPLTVYGAVYWEHTFSILLIFSALIFLVAQPVSYTKAIVLGTLSGLAVWFRPEMLLLCLLFIAMVLFNNFKKKNKENIVFILSALAGITAFFIFNYRVYGNILGAHSYQLSNDDGFISYLHEKFVIVTHINMRLVIFFPVVILLYALAIYIFFIKASLPRVISQLTVIIILFSLITPFVLPNAGGKQWGPRYFLPLVPLVITTLCLAVNYFDVKRFMKLQWIMLLSPLIIYSIYVNVFMAHKYLKNDYAYRVKPGLDFLNKEGCNIVVVQNQYIAQEFASLFETKNIFCAENQESFNELQQLFKKAGISRIIYMAADNKKIMLPGNIINGRRELQQIGGYYFGEYIFE